MNDGDAEAAKALAEGRALLDADRSDEAVAVLARVPADHPGAAHARYFEALAWTRLGRLDMARKAYEAARVIYPNDPTIAAGLAGVLSALGGGLRAVGRFGEAEAMAREARDLAPDDARVRANLALVLAWEGRLDEALAVYDEALALTPGDAEIAYARATVLLSMGRFEDGFAAFESRLSCGDSPFAEMALSGLWDGRADVAGKTVLVVAEQGLGDAIQFARFLPALADRGAEVVLACRRALMPLMATLDDRVAVVDKAAPPPAHDLACAIMSLPTLLGLKTEDAVAMAAPYLTPAPERVAAWAERLAALPRPRVGIAWRGSPANVTDTARSMPLTALAGIAGGRPVSLVSLQKGPGADEAREVGGVTDLGPGFDDPDDGLFLDTAAVLTQLDLVVTVDTALAHLAGAMGRPVWVLLSTVPDWRWLRDRADSPWYPTVRLFRQAAFGDWGAVVEDVREALTNGPPYSGA